MGFDLVSHVMSHPASYPDVFVSIFLALGLDGETMENCRKVSAAWNFFIRGYLWQSERVMVRMNQNTFKNEGKSDPSFCLQVAALVPDMVCNFYLVKNHKIPNNSATT